MGNGLGGLLGGLLGLAVVATVAGAVMKGTSAVWGNVKEVSHKVPKGKVNYW